MYICVYNAERCQDVTSPCGFAGLLLRGGIISFMIQMPRRSPECLDLALCTTPEPQLTFRSVLELPDAPANASKIASVASGPL